MRSWRRRTPPNPRPADLVTDDTGSMKPAVKQSVPIAAVVAAVGVVVIGVLVWRRRR